MSNNVRIIDNQCSEFGEYSRSITRPGGMRLDVCAFRKDHQLVIAVVDEDDVHVEEIVFSSEELQMLKEHLNDPITQSILGGEK